MKLTELSVRRPVFASILYIAITLFGLVALFRLPIDLYPEFENPVITVVTLYPGASSWDVEEKITKPLEKSLGILPGLDEVTSRSVEGVSAIYLKFDYGTPLDEAANDVRNAIDFAMQTLPDNVDRPMLFKFNTSFFPIYFGAVVSDQVDLTKEKTWLDDHVVQVLQAIPGVGSAQLWGVAQEEVHVDVRLADLEQRGIAISQVSQVLMASNVAMPAGRLKDAEYDLPLRVPGEYRTVEEIGDTILAAPNGQVVRVRDVADVRQEVREMHAVGRFGGASVAVFMVQKQSGANTVEVARAVKKRLGQMEPQLGKGIRFIEIFDSSDFIQSMIDNLKGSLVIGGLLVIFVVLVFVRRARASLVVAASIPGSMIIAFLLLYLKGYTLNAVSLMALILAVGMVVDNSIVVLENITRHLEEGESPVRSSVAGTREVGLAISASTLTTIGVFLPLMFVKGLVSILFSQLAFAIVVTLVASLFTAVFLTPMLMAWFAGKPRKGRQTYGRRTPDFVNRLEQAYVRLVRWALGRRWQIYLVALVAFLGSLGLILRVGFDFLPTFDSGEVRITIELPPGTALEKTDAVSRRISARLREIPDVENVFEQVGEDDTGWSALMGQSKGTHVIELNLRLKPRDSGRRRVEPVAEDARSVLAKEDGLMSWDVSYGDNGPGQLMGNKPFVIEILGSDYGRMKEAAYAVEALLKGIEGTRDVVAEVPYEKPEVHVEVDRRRLALSGTTMVQASEAVRTSVYGATVTRFRGTGKDIDVVVRLAPGDREDPAKVARIPVSTLAGTAVPLGNLATLGSGFAPMQVDHSAQQRVLRVGANLSGITLAEVSRAFDDRSSDLRRKYDDLSFRLGGQAKQQQETGMDLMLMLVLGLILTYLIMAAQFESFLDPAVIMFSVPFSFTGAFLGLALLGDKFNVLAFLGMIMLIGIVVNNAIVLVDYVNFLRLEHQMPLVEAVVETSRRRLRPILMTTITTLFGVLPLAWSSGEGSELWHPIGVTMLGGLSLSTLTTLIIVPCMYITLERFRRMSRFASRAAVTSELKQIERES